MVPLIFLGQDYAIAEAQIAYVEIPKVALLRTIAGLIAILWALEWTIKSGALQGPFKLVSIDVLAEKLSPFKSVSALRIWLNVHPTRWFLLAAGLFFGSTVLSTVLSGAPATSLWGEIPGQDGYSAYTMASYGVLFAAIATHLTTKDQLGRLLATLVLMGTLVGLYGNLQHFGHDFFNITESTGGGTQRVTIFMGNTIFAAAVLAMTVPLTLVAAAVNLQGKNWGEWRLLSKLGQSGRDTLLASVWASLLAVQLLGLMFTFSRGPWAGAILSLAVFMGLIIISLGWRTLVQVGLVIGLAGAFSAGFLHWQGNVTVIAIGPWFGYVLVLIALAGTFAILSLINSYSRTVLLIAVAGIVVSIAGSVILAPSALSGRGSSGATVTPSAASQIGERLSSIQTDVLGGFIGGRGTHWDVSWKLIKDRPWFEFDDLSFSWLRPLVGYGPDLFRYTYLLESPPEPSDFRPLEPDHAHNFIIHQTVEQGYLGGLAAVALFVSVFGVAAHQLLRRRQSGGEMYRLLLLGLMAIILGRFLEMMVGVARISDLTVLWVLFGLFAALVKLDDTHQDTSNHTERQTVQSLSRRERRRAARASTGQPFNTGLIFRLAIVVWLIGAVGVVTWQKSINSVRASVAEGRALQHFRAGDYVSTIEDLDKAIKLAPGVPNYYNNRAQIFFVYQLNPEALGEPRCSQQSELPYMTCLGIESLESNLESVSQQPFNYRARIAAGNSAFNLRLHDSAADSYGKAVKLVPAAFLVRNDLAESLINLGFFERAIAELDRSLAITGDSTESSTAWRLKGTAFAELGQFDLAIGSLKDSFSARADYGVLEIINQVNVAKGVDLDIGYFDKDIEKDANDAIAHYFRGQANLKMGKLLQASADLDQSFALGIQLIEAIAEKEYARLKTGDVFGSQAELNRVLQLDPNNPLLNAYFGELQFSSGDFERALTHLERANALDPDIGLAYLVRSRIFMSLGLEEAAKSALSPAGNSQLRTALDYVERGQIHAFFGSFDAAISDLDKAIEINANRAAFYSARAEIYAGMDDYESAISDLNRAIGIDSSNGEFFLNRGVAKFLQGETEDSLADFDHAETLGASDIPATDERGPSYFATYTEVEPVDYSTKLTRKNAVNKTAREVLGNYSNIPPEDPAYQDALLNIGKSYIELGAWEDAVQTLSRLIELSPSTAAAYRNRGDAYLTMNRITDAIGEYEIAISLEPMNAANTIARGRGYGELGEFELARNDFDEALRMDANSSNALKFRGYLSVQSGVPSMALPDLLSAIRISPLDHDAYAKRFEAYLESGQTSLALKDLKQAIILSDRPSVYLYRRGSLALEMEDYDLALKSLHDAIGYELPDPVKHPRLATPYIEMGKLLLKTGEPEAAATNAEVAIQILSEDFNSAAWDDYESKINLRLAEAYQLRGDALIQQGRSSEAQIEYQRAEELR